MIILSNIYIGMVHNIIKYTFACDVYEYNNFIFYFY